MKKKEREHLKEDPFQLFVAEQLDKLGKYKKQILGGLAVVLGVVVIIAVTLFMQSQAVKKDNRLYADALQIKSDSELTLDQKIEKLTEMDFDGGISLSGRLLLASLYYEKGDYTKAGEVLDKFPTGKDPLFDDQKELLEAEILLAGGKDKESLEILNRLFSDPQSDVAKDYLLLKMAGIQAESGDIDTAETNLARLGDDYPKSGYSTEARVLSARLKKQKESK